MDEEDPRRLTKPTNDVLDKNTNNDNKNNNNNNNNNTVLASGNEVTALKAENEDDKDNKDHADQTNCILLATSPGTVSDDSTSKPQRRRNKPSLSCETCTVSLKYMCFSTKKILLLQTTLPSLQIKKTKVPFRTHESLNLPFSISLLTFISSSVTGEDRCTQYLTPTSSTDHASSDSLLRCFACVKRRSECHYSHLADLIELLIQSLTQAASFI